jgi:hypothetical protein
MVICPDNAQAIRFSDDGLGVEILDPKVLSAEVLHKYFKHKNVSSFIRQLNNYGFRTIPVLMSSSVVHCFAHDNFRRGRLDLLEGVKRRGNVSDEAVKNAEKLEHLKQMDDQLDQQLMQLRRANDQLARQNRELAEENKRLRGTWNVVQDSMIRFPQQQQQQQEYHPQQREPMINRMVHPANGGPNAESMSSRMHQQQGQQMFVQHNLHHEYSSQAPPSMLSESMPFNSFPPFSDEI